MHVHANGMLCACYSILTRRDAHLLLSSIILNPTGSMAMTNNDPPPSSTALCTINYVQVCRSQTCPCRLAVNQPATEVHYILLPLHSVHTLLSASCRGNRQMRHTTMYYTFISRVQYVHSTCTVPCLSSTPLLPVGGWEQ